MFLGWGKWSVFRNVAGMERRTLLVSTLLPIFSGLLVRRGYPLGTDSVPYRPMFQRRLWKCPQASKIDQRKIHQQIFQKSCGSHLASADLPLSSHNSQRNWQRYELWTINFLLLFFFGLFVKLAVLDRVLDPPPTAIWQGGGTAQIWPIYPHVESNKSNFKHYYVIYILILGPSGGSKFSERVGASWPNFQKRFSGAK